MASPFPVPDLPSQHLQKLAKRVSGFSIFVSVLLIFCGALAILLPIAMSVSVVILVSWLLMIGGALQVVHAFRSKGVGHILWKLAVAALYLVTGAYLLAHLGLGLAALTLVLCAFLVGEGLVDIVTWIRTPKSGISGWLLFDGIVTLILGLMIWRHWPSASLWVIGALVGINMIMTGVTRLMLTLAVRRAMKPILPATKAA